MAEISPFSITNGAHDETQNPAAASPKLNLKHGCRYSQHLYHQGYCSQLHEFLHHVRSSKSGTQLPPEHQDVAAMATGGLVFKYEPVLKILIVRRAPTDSLPNLWEVPGGSVDEGEGILEGLVREVKEETGLTVTDIIDTVGESKILKDAAQKAASVGVAPPSSKEWSKEEWEDLVYGKEAKQQLGQYFRSRSGTKILKLNFLVDVLEVPLPPTERDESDITVRLDPEEHTAYAWATEEELLQNDIYAITHEQQRQVILRGFQLAKERRAVERW